VDGIAFSNRWPEEKNQRPVAGCSPVERIIFAASSRTDLSLCARTNFVCGVVKSVARIVSLSMAFNKPNAVWARQQL